MKYTQLALIATFTLFVFGCSKQAGQQSPANATSSTAAPPAAAAAAAPAPAPAIPANLDEMKAAAANGSYSAAMFLSDLEKAQRGDKDCQFGVGAAYRDGLRIKQDLPQAFHWLSESAKQGQQGAQWILGVMYEKGESVPVDLEKAAYWYGKSAQGADKPAVERAKQSLEAVKKRIKHK